MNYFYARHLPHEVPDDVPFFFTWSLKGAMPEEAKQRLEAERIRLTRQPVRHGEPLRDRRIRESKILFGLGDKVLDNASSGPLHLKDPGAAKIVEDSILFGVGQAFQPDSPSELFGVGQAFQPDSPSELFGVGQAFQPDSLSEPAQSDSDSSTQPDRVEQQRRYELFAWCVMVNHVHVLLKPIWKLNKVMQGIKGFTAFEINRLQNQRGRVFWQDESFDHWVRDEEEMIRIIHYIENNPVAAGLCARPEDWPWSSARFRANWPMGQAFQPEFLQRQKSG